MGLQRKAGSISGLFLQLKVVHAFFFFVEAYPNITRLIQLKKQKPMTTIKDLNNKHLSADKTQAINDALATLEQELGEITVNLSPDERRRYGSISEQNKLLVNKVNDFAINEPLLLSPDVNWEEFKKDYASRAMIEALVARFQKLMDGLENAKTLYDYDNYHAALDDYSYVSYKARTATPGYGNKLKELKQFFSRTKSTGSLPTQSSVK